MFLGIRFTPQQELSAEQAFWLRISNPTIESSNKPPVKVEVPSELPKVKGMYQRARLKILLLAPFRPLDGGGGPFELVVLTLVFVDSCVEYHYPIIISVPFPRRKKTKERDIEMTDERLEMRERKDVRERGEKMGEEVRGKREGCEEGVEEEGVEVERDLGSRGEDLEGIEIEGRLIGSLPPVAHIIPGSRWCSLGRLEVVATPAATISRENQDLRRQLAE
ncbi:hypothetical protein Tco_0231789 [Tanacetum coccineum]